MSDEMIRIRVYASTWKVGSKTEEIIEIPKAEWEEMDEEAREEFMREEMFKLVEWGYEIES